MAACAVVGADHVFGWVANSRPRGRGFRDRAARSLQSNYRRWSLPIDAHIHRPPTRIHPMRPAESVTHADGVRVTSSRVDRVQRAADVMLGAAACAHCRDPEAVPTLAGERARGPDHIYLVCDRCGGRWQCLRADSPVATTDDTSPA